MFTSFPQYMLMAPSFVNVLNVYAFCNLHDVSWGTKGADKPDALPAVTAEQSKEGSIIVEDNVLDEKQLEQAYAVARTRALTRPEKVDDREEPSADVRDDPDAHTDATRTRTDRSAPTSWRSGSSATPCSS